MPESDLRSTRANIAALTQSSGSSGRFWTWSAITAAVVCAVANVHMLWGNAKLSFPFDEISMLQMSRMLAGFEVPQITSAGYFPGWSVLLAPVWWFTQTPSAVYLAAISIGFVLGMATAWPLSSLVYRFGVSRAQSWFVAFVVLTLPSRTVQADFALAERLLFLFVVLTALCAWRLWERPTWASAGMLALVSGAAYFAHARALPLVLVTGIYLVIFLFHRWRPATFGLVALAVVYVSADAIGKHLNEVLLGHPMTQQEGVFDSLNDPRLSLIVRVAIGQFWNQAVSSFGLVVIGVVAVAILVWRAVRARRAEPTLWLAGALTAMALLSVIAWSGNYNLQVNPWRRLDAWIYGRYLDPVTILFVAIGLALVLRTVRRSILWAALAVQVSILLGAIFITAPGAATWGYVTPAHIPGVMPWWWLLPTAPFAEGSWIIPTPWNENSFWFWASVTSLVLPVIILLARSRTKLIGMTALAFALSASVLSNASTDHFHEIEGTPPAGMADLERAIQRTPSASAAYDESCIESGHFRAVARNYYGWWLLPAIMESTNSASAGTPTVDIFVTCADWAGAADAHAVRLGDGSYVGAVVWILPGGVADLLADWGSIP